MANLGVTELQTLEQEISELRLALSTQREENELLRLWREHIAGSAVEDDNPEVSAAMLQGLQYQKNNLEKLTGVNITASRTEFLNREGKTKMVWDAETGRWRREPVQASQESDGLSLMKRQLIEGYCGDTQFQLQLDMTEQMDTEGDVTCHIKNLAISATEDINAELGDVIERLAIDLNAQGFLRLLDSFQIWWSAREKTFQHFIKKYPNIAETPSNKSICFKHPAKKLTFLIEWNLNVTDIYRVVPDIQLTVQVPKKVIPETDVLDAAPEKFKLMLVELGIEKTFNALVSLLLK